VKFQITHPFHPLSGKTFEAIRCRNIWGEDRVTYLDASGEAKRIPLAWTSLAAPDPFLKVSDGQCMVHIKGLLELVKFVRATRGQRG
jgi:hypothetical protein